MNAALLNVAGFVGTLSAIAKGPGASAQSETRKLVQAMADAPLTGPRFPSAPSAEVMEQREELADRLSWQDEQFDAFPPGGWDEHYADDESVADGFEDQW